MRRIINSTYLTLDGVVEEPHRWPPLEEAPESEAVQTELLLACDAVLMGRRTYDVFAAVWPTRSGDPYSGHINSMRKYVVSSTLRNPEWNNTTVIGGDPVAEITRIKEEPGKDIVQYGLGPVSFLMLEHGLLDELRLWVHPLLVGGAGSHDLRFQDCPATKLDLLDSQTLKNGIIILTYRPSEA